MKSILLTKKTTLLVLLVAAMAISVHSKAQNLTFRNSTLDSGSAGANNAVYRFPYVNGTLDALVKITGRSSSQVSLVNIDVSNTGHDKAFQPQITYNNGSTGSARSWWMEFQVTFVTHNGSSPATVNLFNLTALDIDGDNNRLHEWNTFYNINSYTLENNSLLQVSNVLQLLLGILTPGTTFDGIEDDHGGIDTSATNIMTTIRYNNTNSFKFRAGATTTGSSSSTQRNYSFWFRDFAYVAPLVTTLPVEFFSFTAALNQKKVDLKWTTASEINVSHFVVEKSFDGKNFSDAGLVFAYGNTSEKVNYMFSDNVSNVTQGVIYYRLRSVDQDGKKDYSETRIVRISKQSEGLKMVTYPNPVTNELRVTVPSSWQGKAVVMEVYNQSGQRVKTLKSSNASQTETIMVNDLSRGMYLLQASCGDETAQQKIIKD